MKTKENQYQELLTVPRIQFGLMSGHAYLTDPKRLAFTLSRYKFVSKMLTGKNNVLEIGFADAFGTTIVFNEVKKMSACDFDPLFVKDCIETHPLAKEIDFFEHDMVKSSVDNVFDAIYFLDVLEHIQPHDEQKFMTNAVSSLDENGICIVGIPSLESQS